jgi:hypothetical protein
VLVKENLKRSGKLRPAGTNVSHLWRIRFRKWAIASYSQTSAVINPNFGYDKRQLLRNNLRTVETSSTWSVQNWIVSAVTTQISHNLSHKDCILLRLQKRRELPVDFNTAGVAFNCNSVIAGLDSQLIWSNLWSFQIHQLIQQPNIRMSWSADRSRNNDGGARSAGKQLIKEDALIASFSATKREAHSRNFLTGWSLVAYNHFYCSPELLYRQLNLWLRS